MKRHKSSAAAKGRMGRQSARIYRFKILLANVTPQVWRRIEVRGSYTFWDLHVAVQDAMGWRDCHLHEFTIVNLKTGESDRIGIPDDEFPEDRPLLPGWVVKIGQYFTTENPSAAYLYDFGDNWKHSVTMEDIDGPEDGVTYPRCIAGESACPPEDCGGAHGYREFLRVISNPQHPRHSEMLRWAGEGFDPTSFDPAKVHFWDPRRRWKIAFQEQL